MLTQYTYLLLSSNYYKFYFHIITFSLYLL